MYMDSLHSVGEIFFKFFFLFFFYLQVPNKGWGNKEKEEKIVIKKEMRRKFGRKVELKFGIFPSLC